MGRRGGENRRRGLMRPAHHRTARLERIRVIQFVRLRSYRTSRIGCHFNRSTQHLISNYREEDVENEATNEDLLHGSTESGDVGSLAEGGVTACDRPSV